MAVIEMEGPRNAPGADPAPDEGAPPAGVLRRLWAHPRLGLAAAVVLAAGFGAVSGWLTPRGPVTASQALLAMGVALLVGAGAGLATGSRWAMLIAPGAFLVVFELTRLGVDGLTVDGLHLTSLYGMLAFVLGRGVHGVLVLAPMVLGVGYGVWLSGRLGHPAAARPGPTGRALTVVLTLALAAVAFFISRPASTAPVLGAEGDPLPGSVSELTSVEIGGHDQVLMIRGRSIDNPVLLYLSGGPGGTDIGALRADVGLEDDFVVVAWEQRGAGKSYPALDPTDTFTVDRLVADTIEVTDYLRERFDEDRIYLVGQSWGSTLGVLAARERPDLYHAFVGVGQMVSQRETDIMAWEDTLAWAERTGNAELADSLQSAGPPPYDDIIQYEQVVSYEHDWNPYPELDLSKEMPAILFVPEYSWMDRINAFRAFLDTNAALYPALQQVDFRQDVPRLDVPYYMVLGEHETRGRSILAEEWFALVDAPRKERVIFEGAGHRPNFDRPDLFADLMNRAAADTYPSS
ncbi:MAG: alpha/beta fold hydrolase [Actinomycetota bacterium]